MNKRSIVFIAILSAFSFASFAQKKPVEKKEHAVQPKLVVGLVVDQMRWDYLYKYKRLYGSGGFRRLLGEGFSCDNAMISHLPTYTAVGHTGIYTGSLPAIHGIVGNNWYDRATDKLVYCTDDAAVTGIGSDNESGKMSPRNMLTTTIGDQLRLSNNFKSKVIGISLKDRGAILPAGHTANAAYWFDDKEGIMISSSFYMNNLPNWVKEFNGQKLPDQYMSRDWNTILPEDLYDLSTLDEEPFEGNIPGIKTDTFPYHLKNITEKKYRAFRFTPFGNTYTLQFAAAAIDKEKLGANGVTDFLAVSLSSTDYIGHTFGPNAVEIEDTYLRLDRDIESFLKMLDEKIGKGNYLFFLTADHGVAHNPEYMAQKKIPSGHYEPKDLMKELNDSLSALSVYASKIDHIENSQLYVGKHATNNAVSGSTNDFSDNLVRLLEQKSYISHAVDLQHIEEASLPAIIITMLKNSYYPKRSGDFQYIPNPAWLEGSGKGTTHGLWNPYDAHIPLVFFGTGIKQGRTYREVHMSDIAPTLAAMLDIQMPNGCVGEVIAELVK